MVRKEVLKEIEEGKGGGGQEVLSEEQSGTPLFW